MAMYVHGCISRELWPYLSERKLHLVAVVWLSFGKDLTQIQLWSLLWEAVGVRCIRCILFYNEPESVQLFSLLYSVLDLLHVAAYYSQAEALPVSLHITTASCWWRHVTSIAWFDIVLLTAAANIQLRLSLCAALSATDCWCKITVLFENRTVLHIILCESDKHYSMNNISE
jgi:hypothetical protein